jgi:L-amino acid N-acyltransferase YncA
MIIRKATEEDWPALRKMVGWLDKENTARGQDSVRTEIVAGMLHAYNTGQEIVVAEFDGGELKGFCAWVQLPMTGKDAMGLGTYVWPESLRRTGIGRSMREMAERLLVARGVRAVVGVAAAGNDAGLVSCLADGFRITGYVVKKEFGHEGQEEQRGREEGQRQGDGPEGVLN